MNMDWSKFFAMGGYAFYVWGSYIVALIAMGGEVLLLWRRKKALLAQAHPAFSESNSNEKTS